VKSIETFIYSGYYTFVILYGGNKLGNLHVNY